jgi:hypothetical protein
MIVTLDYSTYISDWKDINIHLILLLIVILYYFVTSMISIIRVLEGGNKALPVIHLV